MRAALAVSLKLASKEDSGRGLNREMPADQDKQAIHRAVHAEVCDKLGRAQKVSHQGPASLKGMPSMRTCLYPVQMSKPENLPGGWSWTRWAGPGGSGGLGVCPPLQSPQLALQTTENAWKLCPLRLNPSHPHWAEEPLLWEARRPPSDVSRLQAGSSERSHRVSMELPASCSWPLGSWVSGRRTRSP